MTGTGYNIGLSSDFQSHFSNRRVVILREEAFVLAIRV